MAIEWVDPPKEPGYRRPEGSGVVPYHEEQRRAQVQAVNQLLGVSAAGVGLCGLWWIVRRRQSLGHGAVAGLGVIEAWRRKLVGSAKSLGQAVKDEADKRG